MNVARVKRLLMKNRECIVCRIRPAYHIFKIMEGNKEKIQYLCSEHFLEIDDPKRFFSILDDIHIPHEEGEFFFSSEIFSD